MHWPARHGTEGQVLWLERPWGGGLIACAVHGSASPGKEQGKKMPKRTIVVSGYSKTIGDDGNTPKDPHDTILLLTRDMVFFTS